MLRHIHRAFISYSRNEYYFAEQLAVSLRRHGLAVWFDVHELRAGTEWQSAIDTAIADCDTFVLVASRAALASPYVQRERDLAAELNRPCVAVLSHQLAPPEIAGTPLYDLRSGFRRGVDRLVDDLVAGRLRGRRRRPPLPFPATAILVALAPASCLLFALVLGLSFADTVVGREPVIGLDPSDTRRVMVLAIAMIGIIGIWSGLVLRAFIVRRATWLSLRGSQFLLPVITVVVLGFAETMAEYLTTDPIVLALQGQSDEFVVGDAPAFLWFGVTLASIAAAIATPFSAGVFRHLKTGVAPSRVRRRHIGAVPRPADSASTHSFRLLAAGDDSRVADEVRLALADAGMSEVGDGDATDRLIVVVSDRTPADWMSDTLQNPMAVVATSIALPVRGVLQQFQWVDYRRRRRRTLAALAGDLSSSGPGTDMMASRVLPERLQQLRLPFWVGVVVYLLVAMATLATIVAAYPLEQRLFTDQDSDAWPNILCLPIAVGLVLIAILVRRRRITPGALVLAVAVSWLGMAACRLNGVARAAFTTPGSETYVEASVFYSLVSVVIVALSWRSLRRWLPRRLRPAGPAQPTLGSASGSWPWRMAAAPLSMGLLTAASITAPLEPVAVADTSSTDWENACRDQADLSVLFAPIDALNTTLNEAIADVDGDAVLSMVRQRVETTATLIDDLEGYEPTGTWGADMRARLIAAYERMAVADQTFLDSPRNPYRAVAPYEEVQLARVQFDSLFLC